MYYPFYYKVIEIIEYAFSLCGGSSILPLFSPLSIFS